VTTVSVTVLTVTSRARVDVPAGAPAGLEGDVHGGDVDRAAGQRLGGDARRRGGRGLVACQGDQGGGQRQGEDGDRGEMQRPGISWCKAPPRDAECFGGEAVDARTDWKD
jgi:hypothetical protein